MLPKRHLGDGGEEDRRVPDKRRHLLSTLFMGVRSSRALQDCMPRLESIVREWVREEVDRVFDPLLRSSETQTESSGSRALQLRFHSNIPHTVFTGNRLVSKDTSPIKVALHDSASGEIVTSGPYSSMKVDIVTLEGDFDPNSLEKEFDGKVVQNRQGKRPLVAGEPTVSLQNGEGYIGNISFTDNSSWTRSGKFLLGVKARSGFDSKSVREGVSNAFKVKDQRGESYKKNYPPSFDDEVWRLEKIAKDGTSHKRLSQSGISCVGDFLTMYTSNPLFLRSILGNVSNKKWDAIIRHATTCTMVKDLQQHAYGNSSAWENREAYLPFGQAGQLEMQMNPDHPTVSTSNGEEGQENSSLEVGKSSQVPWANLAFPNSPEDSTPENKLGLTKRMAMFEEH